MSFSKPPVAVSGIALLAALSLVSTQGWARDGRRVESRVQEIEPMTADQSHEIIYIMPPMKPVPGMEAHLPKAAAKPEAQPTSNFVTTPAPAQTAPVAEAPKPAETQQPVAEAPKPAEAVQTPAEALSASQQPSPVEAPAVAGPANPIEPPLAMPAEGQAAAGAQPAPVEQQIAGEAPRLAEPAPIGPPIMSLNTPRKALSGVKQPAASLDQHVIELQGASVAPALVPRLQSTAKAVAEQTPAVAPEQMAPNEGANPAEAQASAPVDPAVALAQSEARISALLAEGVAGPADIRIADRATLWLPAGRVFLPAEAARKLAKEAGLEWRANVLGLIAPSGGKLQWLAPVELFDDGFIKTGDPDAIQPDKLLAAFAAGLPETNAQRARTGQPPVTLGGWLSAPTLDEKRRLSACVNITTQNEQNGLDRFFNCEAWALGRQGAIKVALADGGEEAERLKGEAKALADTIVFDKGKTYEEFDAATDKVAPYAAADMLTRDVAAQTPHTPVEVEAEASSPVDLLSKLLGPALLGAAALGLYVWIKRRRAADEDSQTATAKPVIADSEQPDATDAPASLFARLLPTLYARFAARTDEAGDAPAMKSMEAAIQAQAAGGTPKSIDDTPAAALGGLKGMLSKMRSAAPQEEAKPNSAPAPLPGGVEEPASALKKLASRMRRTEEAPVASVDVTRIMRPTRTLPGAAPATAERYEEPVMMEAIRANAAPEEIEREEPKLVEPKSFEARPVETNPIETKPVAVDPKPSQQAPVFVAASVEPRAIEPKQALDRRRASDEESGADSDAEHVEGAFRQTSAKAPPSQPVFDDDDFGLVEPGDAEAASAAINAARARREANG